jgi:hypothetical protein
VPFQVDPMLIPMFGRGNLSKKFAAGGNAKSGVTSKPINAVRTKNYAFGGGVSQLDQPKIEKNQHAAQTLMTLCGRWELTPKEISPQNS